MEGPPQLREGPASLRARAHRAGQAVCQRVPPRTSHCHTACTPPCPIIAIIRLRPGRPFPWPTALHNRGLCKLGAGPSGPETAVESPRTRTAAAATLSRTSTGDRASSRLAPASGSTDWNDLDPLPKRASKLTSSALRAGHRRTVSRARFASAVSTPTASSLTAAASRASLPGRRWRGGSPASRLPFGGASAGLDPDDHTARRQSQGAMLRKKSLSGLLPHSTGRLQ
jgi:hypothetical protein